MRKRPVYYKIKKKGDNAMNNGEKQGFFKKYRIDIIVVSVLLLLSLVALLVMSLNKEEGAYAEITIDGSTVARYSLSKDGVYTLNGGTNTLTIKDGKAYMTESNCPDHKCENMGKMKYVGQTIVCLPNKLTVTIVGESENSVDFVS